MIVSRWVVLRQDQLGNCEVVSARDPHDIDILDILKGS